MLNAMCMNPFGSCRNMYVTTVHGRLSTSAGTKTSERTSWGAVNSRK